MTIEQAKEMDMVDYLSSLGYQPQRNSRQQYWYLSPLRQEKTPSFKINRIMNRWYDFGEGTGGNLVDFGIRFYQCSVSDFLQKLTLLKPSLQHSQTVKILSPTMDEEANGIHILSEHTISSYALVKYLHNRRIADAVAAKYLKEIRYSTGNKIYYALGFKNDAGGYELRNEKFKGSSSPKDITFIDNGACRLAIFEGFFNFLSHRSLQHQQEQPLLNFLVLNSTSFFEKSLPVMQAHEQVQLFLDNDRTGQKCTRLALELDCQKFTDERRLYQGYNDLNDWQVHMGQSQKQQLRLNP